MKNFMTRAIGALFIAGAFATSAHAADVSNAAAKAPADANKAPAAKAARPAGNAESRGNAAKAKADLEALTKAARAEGQVVFYSAATENVARRVADAFTRKYGIKASYTRFPSVTLQQRYATEAEGGTFAADLIFNAGGSVPYAAAAINKGWVESISLANLPVITSGEFPQQFNRGPTALIQIAPWYLFYNSAKLSAAEVPKDWPDLINPKFKGQILVPNPRSSDAYLDFWGLLYDKYGEKFFADLRALELRAYPSGVPATQALGAGEGMLMIPGVPGLLSGIKEKGAPVALVKSDFTTGVEMQVMLTARDKAKNPNAARLLANWVMTPEGNKVFNDDPDGFSIYDTKAVPKEYKAPKMTGEINRRDMLAKLLGL